MLLDIEARRLWRYKGNSLDDDYNDFTSLLLFYLALKRQSWVCQHQYLTVSYRQ